MQFVVAALQLSLRRKRTLSHVASSIPSANLAAARFDTRGRRSHTELRLSSPRRTASAGGIETSGGGRLGGARVEAYRCPLRPIITRASHGRSQRHRWSEGSGGQGEMAAPASIVCAGVARPQGFQRHVRWLQVRKRPSANGAVRGSAAAARGSAIGDGRVLPATSRRRCWQSAGRATCSPMRAARALAGRRIKSKNSSRTLPSFSAAADRLHRWPMLRPLRTHRSARLLATRSNRDEPSAPREKRTERQIQLFERRLSRVAAD